MQDQISSSQPPAPLQTATSTAAPTTAETEFSYSAARGAEPGVQRLKGVNWSGLYTLYMKEVQRFYKVQLQTIWAPAVTSLLFLAIFTFALGSTRGDILGMSYVDFLAPGLIIMGMAQNSFANSSSSMLIAKVQGTIVDILMPPLSSGEVLTAMVAGAVTRAWAVGLVVWGALLLWPGVEANILSLPAALFFGTAGAMMMALIGVLTGIWAEKFDHGAFVTNFIIQPLTLLSGTFYTITQLPPVGEQISRANPFFYMIDGFRSAFIGIADSPPLVSAAVVGGLSLVLWAIAYALLQSGWKLRD